MVLGGCIGEATAPFLVSLAIAHFGPEAFVVCIGALIVALVLNYAALHVYLKAIPAAPHEEREELGSEWNKGMSRQNSPVLQRRRPPSTSSRSLLDKDVDRQLDAHTERCYYNTESPRSLMNYTGVSGVNKFSAFSEDGQSENEQEAGESDASEFAQFVLPSARYHAVRCVDGFNANSTNVGIAISIPHTRSESPFQSIHEHSGHTGSGSFLPETCSAGKGHLSFSAGSSHGNNNNEAGASLYARSFRRQVPMLRHPLNNQQYEQLLQEEEEHV